MTPSQPNVPLTELNETRTFFEDHFKLGPTTNPAPIYYTLQEYPMSQLTDLFTGIGGSIHALKIHYGLNSNSDFVFGLSALELDGSGHVTNTYNISYGNRSAGNIETTTEAVLEVNRLRYMDTVVTRRDDSATWTPLANGTDPHSCILNWEDEVQLMINQNYAEYGGNISDYKVVFASIATQSNAHDYAHSVAIYLKKNNSALLDNTAYTNIYISKACDMGHLCPTNCLV
ncbi:MAG: hypothetical protein NTX03_15345 [Bacteroidetes bacterium]|nr:hypothetical protein [Bacteroidota bacterium]